MVRVSRRPELAAIAFGAIAIIAACTLAMANTYAVAGSADTLNGALVQAYQNNPQLNAERARLRATDEGVPQALSGYRPQISATADIGAQYIDSQTSAGAIRGASVPHGVGVTGTQTVFNGLRTGNRTRAAESQVFAGREALRVMEQQILLDAATAYMNVLRDTAILDLQRRNVEVLEEQLRQTRDRFNVGEVTRTDVAQAESRLAAARSSALGAEVHADHLARNVSPRHRRRAWTPRGRHAGRPAVARHLGRRDRGRQPSRTRTSRRRCTGSTFSCCRSRSRRARSIRPSRCKPASSSGGTLHRTPNSTFTASAVAQMAIPIYQGGGEYSLIRQSKETLAQQRLNLELTRDQVRALVVQSWGQLEAAKAQIQAAQAQVTAAEIALNGVREEARVGQRTTLDVLNAQQELVNARVTLVTAQRDRVVNSYALLAASGRSGGPDPATAGAGL